MDWTLVLSYLFAVKKHTDLSSVIIIDTTRVILFFVPTLVEFIRINSWCWCWLWRWDPNTTISSSGRPCCKSVWMQLICVNQSSIHSLHCNICLDKSIQQHCTLFSDELVSLTGTTALILISLDAQPRYFKPRCVLKEKLEQELLRIQKEGIITPVKFSDLTAPIIPITKYNGQVHICEDYKLTVNQTSKLYVYLFITTHRWSACMIRGWGLL